MSVCVCAYKFHQACNLWARFNVKVWSNWGKVNQRRYSVPGCIRRTGSLRNLNNDLWVDLWAKNVIWESNLMSPIWKNWLHSQPLAVSNLWEFRFDFGCTYLPYLFMTNHSIFTWASRLLYHETVQLFRVDYPQQGSAKHRWSKRGFKSSREPEREASGVPKQANRLAVTCGNWITCRSGMRR